MDGVLVRIFSPILLWLIIARNTVIQPQCPSSTPRLIGEGSRCAKTLGMVEPGKRTGGLFAPTLGPGTRSAIASSIVHCGGCRALLVLHQSVTDTAAAALATSGGRWAVGRFTQRRGDGLWVFMDLELRWFLLA